MNSYSKRARDTTPILLLKTPSPDDAYRQLFSKPINGIVYRPIFVPVLQHHFNEDNLNIVRKALRNHRFDVEDGDEDVEEYVGEDDEEDIDEDRQKYGGLIFTSQRAVEAFSSVVQAGKGPENWPWLDNVPIYVVGPATSRSLRAIKLDRPLNLFGAETGNGEVLAHFIIDHYAEWYKDTDHKHQLLFLVGEQRRDIIPKTLKDPALIEGCRIDVRELEVYGTKEMDSFPQDFVKVLQETENRPMRWVVVFSPAGCEAMLRALNLLDPYTGRAKPDLLGMSNTYIATIGPTTRDHLREKFGFNPDVCAESPTPEGLEAAISDFISRRW